MWRTNTGEPGSGLTAGTRTFDTNGGLAQLDALANGNSNTQRELVYMGAPVDPGTDGIVTWGRWIDGYSQVKDGAGLGKGRIATLHYFAFGDQPSLPVIGAFSSFASTAPTVASGGTIVSVGELNAARGAVNVAFLTASGGSASYSLVVPVSGQSFSLTGLASQVSTFGFAGVSDIRSSGSGCDGGCTGTLGNNNVSVIGLVGGAASNRVGVTYGFDSRIGNVSGVIVFKR